MVITFDLKIGQIYKNSFNFAFINIKKNLLIGISSILYFAIMYGILYMIPTDFTLALIIIFTICFYPGFKNLLIQFCVFPVIKKYMIDPYYNANPDADIELRKGLGLEVPNEEEDEIFDDNRKLPPDLNE